MHYRQLVGAEPVWRNYIELTIRFQKGFLNASDLQKEARETTFLTHGRSRRS
jgi:hypothetical protein